MADDSDNPWVRGPSKPAEAPRPSATATRLLKGRQPNGSIGMLAKYHGTCKRCGGHTYPGDPIFWGRHAGTVHQDCGPDNSDRLTHLQRLQAARDAIRGA